MSTQEYVYLFQALIYIICFTLGYILGKNEKLPPKKNKQILKD